MSSNRLTTSCNFCCLHFLMNEVSKLKIQSLFFLRLTLIACQFDTVTLFVNIFDGLYFNTNFSFNDECKHKFEIRCLFQGSRTIVNKVLESSRL